MPDFDARSRSPASFQKTHPLRQIASKNAPSRAHLYFFYQSFYQRQIQLSRFKPRAGCRPERPRYRPLAIAHDWRVAE